MKINNKIKIIMIFLVITLFAPKITPITGQDATGTYTISGHLDTTAFNATNTYSIRGLIDLISAQFKYPSSESILYRGRFSQLKADNTKPNIPNILEPTNNSGYNTTTVTFIWENSTDPDNDTHTYYFELWNNSILTEQYDINRTIKETTSPTTHTLTLPEQTYYWRLLANDSRLNSSYTTLRTMIVLDRTYPTAPNLTSPVNNTESTDTSPTLNWQTSTEENLANYTIEFSSNNTFSNIDISLNTTTNSFSEWSTSDLLTKQDWYWRVKAIDKSNNINISKEYFKYTVIASKTVETLQTIVEETSGGGTKKQPFTFEILAPPSITIFLQEGKIVLPLKLKNPSKEVYFRLIKLEAIPDTPDIQAELSRNLIQELPAGKETQVDLTLTVLGKKAGVYGITLKAEVTLPPFSDSVKLFTNVVDADADTTTSATKQLAFAEQLFTGNLICADLKEYITLAQEAYDKGQTLNALQLAQTAIDSCKELIKIQEKQPIKKLTLEKIIQELLTNKKYLYIALEVSAAIALITIAFKIFRRKRKIVFSPKSKV